MQIDSILIVDDNEADRYLLKRVLRKLNLSSKIHEADDGKTALEFLGDYQANKQKFESEFPPNLIFLDINMPMVDGFEFLLRFSEMKQQSSLYDAIILIMFTSSGREDEIEKALSYEFVKDYLLKGDFDSDLLEEKISAHLNCN